MKNPNLTYVAFDISQMKTLYNVICNSLYKYIYSDNELDATDYESIASLLETMCTLGFVTSAIYFYKRIESKYPIGIQWISDHKEYLEDLRKCFKNLKKKDKEDVHFNLTFILRTQFLYDGAFALKNLNEVKINLNLLHFIGYKKEARQWRKGIKDAIRESGCEKQKIENAIWELSVYCF